MLRAIPQKGTIAVIAPAFPPDSQKLEAGILYLQNKGFSVVRGRSLTARQGYFAGSDALRLDELHEMFANPQVDAIICARGGWGTLRLLDRLDYELIRQNPKALVGYSDITTLQLALWQKAGLPSLSGPMAAVEMGGGILPFTEEYFWGQVFNSEKNYRFDFSRIGAEIWREGAASGVLLGGCLSMVAHQLGTPYCPDFAQAILFLEDVGEAPYKIDRYLAQLKMAGIFDNINGLILGNFLDCTDDYGMPIREVLEDYFNGAPFPVIYDFPYGHGMKKFTMPVGMPAQLDTDSATLIVDNPFYE